MASDELRRYTDVLSVADMLRHKRITLLSPAKWADQNDSHSLEVYRRKLGVSSIVALCLTEASETYHHWQVFAGHGHGACVVFDKARLIARLQKSPALTFGQVHYKPLAYVEKSRPLPVDELPFVKRNTFRDEKEFRIIAQQDGLFADSPLNVGIDLDIVKQVIFSPLAPRALLETMKEILSSFEGCDSIRFSHSRLTNNPAWRRAIAASDDAST
jgi:hypothetical protein